MLTATVLLVTNDPIQRDLNQMALERSGFRVVTARASSEVHALFTICRPQVMVLDLLQPQVHGLELLAQLKQHNLLAGVSTIIISALGYKEIVEEVLETGATDFLLKPYDVDLLVQRVKLALKRKGGVFEQFIYT